MGQSIGYFVNNIRQAVYSKSPQINQSKKNISCAYSTDEWELWDSRSFTNSAVVNHRKHNAFLSIQELESFPDSLLDLIIEYSAEQCCKCHISMPSKLETMYCSEGVRYYRSEQWMQVGSHLYFCEKCTMKTVKQQEMIRVFEKMKLRDYQIRESMYHHNHRMEFKDQMKFIIHGVCARMNCWIHRRSYLELMIIVVLFLSVFCAIRDTIFVYQSILLGVL